MPSFDFEFVRRRQHVREQAAAKVAQGKDESPTSAEICSAAQALVDVIDKYGHVYDNDEAYETLRALLTRADETEVKSDG